MGYEARGEGLIGFVEANAKIRKEEWNEIQDILSEYFELTEVRYPWGHYLNLVFNGRYREEDIMDALNRVAKIGNVIESNIKFIGDDDSIWRIVYKNDSFVCEHAEIIFDEPAEYFLKRFLEKLIPNVSEEVYNVVWDKDSLNQFVEYLMVHNNYVINYPSLDQAIEYQILRNKQENKEEAA